MKGRRAVVLLLPSRIDVALLVRGRVVASRRVPVSLENEPAAWAATIVDAAPALRDAVTALGAENAEATALYRSPTQAVDLGGFPVSPAEAIEAAKLECCDALPYPSAAAICEAMVIGRDRHGDQRPQHVLVAADRDDIVESVVRLVEGSGLRYGGALPLDAALQARLLRGALRSSASPSDSRLYVGEQGSIFVVAAGGNLVFTRQIRLGLETIAESLTRPFQAPGESEAVELDAAAARRILHRFGRPKHDEIVDEQLGLRGARLIPLMQPVLQRLVVELRQSLRFGLSEQQRQGLRITLTGPGSTLPGFAKLLGEELGVEMTVDETYRGYLWSEPASPGSELVDAISDVRLLERLSLQPARLRYVRTAGQLRRWFWTGGAAALIVIGIDAARAHQRLEALRSETAAVEGSEWGRQQLDETRQRLASLSAAMGALDRTIAQEMVDQPKHRAVLQELSRLAPGTVRLNTITLTRTDERTAGHITGLASSSGGRTDLEPFIQALKGSPLFSDVSLGIVQAAELAQGGGERFEATFEAVAVPPPVIAGAGDRGEQAP